MRHFSSASAGILYFSLLSTLAAFGPSPTSAQQDQTVEATEPTVEAVDQPPNGQEDRQGTPGTKGENGHPDRGNGNTAETESIGSGKETLSLSTASSTSSLSTSSSADGATYSIDVDAVGSGGEFTYRYDFDLPAYRGLVPNIGLSYNSSNISRVGERKLVAFGWTLTGFSMIERKSLGKGVPTFEEGQDVFLLDGQELLVCSDTAGHTNPWPDYPGTSNPSYPLRYYTDTGTPVASCLAGGNMATRIESYQRINYDVTANVFTITRKDGVQYRYESVAEARGDTPAQVWGQTGLTELQQMESNSRWLLTEIKDTQATPNVVTINYDFDTVDTAYASRPSSVSYGGYDVNFHYSELTKPMGRFATGTQYIGEQLYKLDVVEVKDGAGQVRAYGLEHSSSALTQTQLLDRVIPYGDDYTLSGNEILLGSGLPAVEFAYSVDDVTFSSQTLSGVGTSPVFRTDRDLTGSISTQFANGSAFKFKNPDPSNYSSPRTITNIAKQILDCDSLITGHGGSGGYVEASSFENPGILQTDRSSLESSCLKYIRNDNLTSNGFIQSSSRRARIVSIVDEPGETEIQDEIRCKTDFAPAQGCKKGQFVHGNFDLDPESEILFQNWLFDINGNSFSTAVEIPDSYSYTSPFKTQFHFDADGNGALDSLGEDGSFYRIRPEIGFVDGFSSARMSYKKVTLPGSSVSSLTDNSFVVLGFGDLNYDGVNDSVAFDSHGGYNERLKINLGTGNWFKSVQYITLSGGVLESELDLHFGGIFDLNSDGLADLVLHEGKGGTTPATEVSVYINVGDDFELTQIVSSLSVTGFIGASDLDGDGLVDLLTHGHPGKIYWSSGGVPNRMIQITEPTGGEVHIEYQPSSVFGQNQMPGVQQVVKSITRKNGLGDPTSDRTTGFAFVENKYAFTDRAPLGWGEITATLPEIDGSSADLVIKRLNDSIVDAGKVYERTLSKDGSVWSQEITDWIDIPFGFGGSTESYDPAAPHDPAVNGPFRKLPVKITSHQRMGAGLIGTSTELAFDTTYGDRVAVTEHGLADANGTDLAPGDNIHTELSYVHNLSDYIVDRPSERKVYKGTAASGNTADWIAQEFFSYDGQPNASAPTRGNLTKVEIWDGTGTTSLTDEAAFAYDAYGNTLWEDDALGHRTSYTYDTSRHLFRTSETNAEGHTVTTTWDEACQAPDTVTDANSLVTSFTYDIHCRETRQDYPDTSYLTTAYLDLGDPALQSIETRRPSGSLLSNAAETIERTWFDGFGETYRTETSGRTNDPADLIVGLSRHDARGRLVEQSIPLSPSEAAVSPLPSTDVATFAYDPLGRVLETVNPDGSKTTQSYVHTPMTHWGASVDVPTVHARDENCHDANGATICGEVWTMSDSRGNVVRTDRNDALLQDVGATAATATTEFFIDRSGNLTDVIDPSGQQWTYTYDVFGNRLTADDPSLGLWTMSYDRNNNLIGQTDAAGNTIAFTYDDINRPLTKTVSTSGNAQSGSGHPFLTIYSHGSQDVSGTVSTSSDGTTITIEGNAWKHIDAPITITPTTVLRFHYFSDNEGEQHAIGFKNTNDGGGNMTNLFQVHGTQGWGLETTYDGQYATGDPAQLYEIPIGQHYTGTFDRLVFVADDDVAADAKSVFSNIQYGEPGNLHTVNFGTTSSGSNGSEIVTTMTYDQAQTGGHNIGQLTTIANPDHSIAYEYGLNGQVARETHTIGAQSYDLEYSYDSAGNLLDQKLPATASSTATSWTGTFAYDAAGRPISFGSHITDTTYDRRSQPLTTTFGSGASTAFSYDPERGWVDTIEAFNGASASIAATAYTRNPTGQIASMDSNLAAGDYAYSYDYAGRLLSADNTSDDQYDQSFTYYRSGSIASNSHVGDYYYSAFTPAFAPETVVTSVGTETLTYDANGNMLTGFDGKVMTYDGENRPLSVTRDGVTTSYVYGADGSRLKTIVAGETTLTFGPVEIRAFNGATTGDVITYPHPDIRLVNGTAEALHRDQLASVRAITDTFGALVTERSYKPFGEITVDTTSVGVADETKGYIGERYDSDAGLQYLNARYYDPALAMFIQSDWWEVTEPGVGTNRYAYTGNDPVNASDPGGNGFLSGIGDALRDAGQSIRESFRALGDAISGNVTRIANDPTNGRFGSAHVNGVTYSCYGCQGTTITNGPGTVMAAAIDVASTSIGVSQSPSNPASIGDRTIGKPRPRGGSHWQYFAGALVELADKLGMERFFHYTSATGADSINASGVIIANERGIVYLTRAQLGPNDARNSIFIMNPSAVLQGKGDFAAVVWGSDDFVRLLTPDPSIAIGLRHPGSIRNRRGHSYVTEARQNPFPDTIR